MEQIKNRQLAEFVAKHAGECEDHWPLMLMSAIQHGLPEVYMRMADTLYHTDELVCLIMNNI